MVLEYNADEIFEIAEHIERNGAKFYRDAAEVVKEPSTNQLLLSLAAWEEQHERLFASMREEFSREDKEMALSDPDEQATLYLRAAADTHVFNVRNLSGILQGNETPEEVLNIALGFEKDSIVFFLAMKELVPESLGADKVDAILHEEMQHATTLTKQLNDLKKQ